MITIKQITDILDLHASPYRWEYDIMEDHVFIPFTNAESHIVKVFEDIFNNQRVFINLIDGDIIIKPK